MTGSVEFPYYNEGLNLSREDLKQETETKANQKLGVWIVTCGYEYDTCFHTETFLDGKQALEYARGQRMLDSIEYKEVK